MLAVAVSSLSWHTSSQHLSTNTLAACASVCSSGVQQVFWDLATGCPNTGGL